MHINNFRLLTVTLIVSFLFSFSNSAFAQVIGILCANTKTKVITVARAACPTGTVRLNMGNLSSTSSCYTASASNSGAVPSGRVSVTVNCRSGFFVESDAFDVNDQTRAYPSLASKTLIFTKGSKLPTGVQFEMLGNQNLFYSVTGQAVCCP